MENTSKPCKWGISNSNQALHPKGSLKFPRKFLQGSLFSGLCTLCSSRNKSCSNDGPLYLILVPFIIPFLQKCTLPLASVKLYVFLSYMCCHFPQKTGKDALTLYFPLWSFPVMRSHSDSFRHHAKSAPLSSRWPCHLSLTIATVTLFNGVSPPRPPAI